MVGFLIFCINFLSLKAILASLKGYIEIIEILLKEPQNINNRDFLGSTAIKYGDFE
jgi:hypothetical protein